MPIPEPRTYDVPEIERLAYDFLHERYRANVPIPIDIDFLIEELPDVDLDIWPGLRANHQLEGMVMRDADTGAIVVCIDDTLADKNPTRYRMTVAEELGHLILHRKLIEQVKSPADFRSIQSHYRAWQMERNAKRFAAAILMPSASLSAAACSLYPKLVGAVGFKNPDAVRRKLVAMLAQSFGVSPEAMRIRCTEWPMKIDEKIEQAMRDQLDFLS